MPFYALIQNRERQNCVVRRNAKAGRNRLIHHGTMQRELNIRIRAEMDPPFLHFPLSLSLPSPSILPDTRPLANVAKSESDPDAGKSRASISSPFTALLLNARFPDYARFSSLERLGETLKQDSKDRISLPQDRSGVLKVTFRHGVAGPARRAGFIR